MTGRCLERPVPIGGAACAPLGVAALLSLFVFLLPNASQAKNYSLYGRDIGCAEVVQGRPRRICEAISTSLSWQWMGHAVMAPGYKPSFKSIRNVYCKLKVGKEDVKTLQDLKQYDPRRRWLPDWRLESGADMLLRIIASLDNKNEEAAGSIFDPKNSNYILKNGCP
jgi:hypothetical protein